MNFYETKHTNKKKISIKAYSFFGKIYIIKIVYFTNETIFIINIQIHIYIYIQPSNNFIFFSNTYKLYPRYTNEGLC